MIDIGGNDGAARRDFLTDKLRRHIIGDLRAKTLAIADQLLFRSFTSEIFPDGDEFHFRRDDAGPRIGKLRHGLAPRRPERLMAHGKFRRQALAGRKAVILRFDVTPVVSGDIATGHDPVVTQARQTLFNQNGMRGIGIGPGGIVDRDRRFARRRVHGDFAHRHANMRMQYSGLMDFRGGGMWPGCDRKRDILGNDIHHEAPKFDSGDPVRAGMMENTEASTAQVTRNPTLGLCTVPTPV